MSSCRESINKIKSKEIDINQIVIFLKLIGSMAGGMLVLSLLCFMIFPKANISNVVYTLVIGLNGIVLLGVAITSKFLIKKQKELKVQIEKMGTKNGK